MIEPKRYLLDTEGGLWADSDAGEWMKAEEVLPALEAARQEGIEAVYRAICPRCAEEPERGLYSWWHGMQPCLASDARDAMRDAEAKP